jgi:hypothetical protein
MLDKRGERNFGRGGHDVRVTRPLKYFKCSLSYSEILGSQSPDVLGVRLVATWLALLPVRAEDLHLGPSRGLARPARSLRSRRARQRRLIPLHTGAEGRRTFQTEVQTNHGLAQCLSSGSMAYLGVGLTWPASRHAGPRVSLNCTSTRRPRNCWPTWSQSRASSSARRARSWRWPGSAPWCSWPEPRRTIPQALRRRG